MKFVSIEERAINLLNSTGELGGDFKQITASDWLVLAISGGPDSLTLLHLMANQIKHRTDRLVVVHLNHDLRGEADYEAEHVAELASQLDLPCVVKKQNIAVMAREQGMSLEEAGRTARYRLLRNVAEQFGAPAVLTGHNAQDQVETVLMHILRGSGLAGLRGMQPVSYLPGSSSKMLIRPLLETEPQEIEAYCRDHKLSPTFDKSNLDIRYERNWIRQQLLPILEGRRPGVSNRLKHLGTLAAADYQLLAVTIEHQFDEILLSRGNGWLTLDLEKWQALPLASKRLTIRSAIQQIHDVPVEMSFKVVESARQLGETGQVGKAVNLPTGSKIQIGYRELKFTLSGRAVPLPELPQLLEYESQSLSIPGNVAIDDRWMLGSSIVENPDFEVIVRNPDPWTAYIGVDNREPLIIRRPIPRELFLPLGMAKHRAKIGDVLANRKVPAELREAWPVVANENHLIWLVGHQLDDRIKLTEDSRSVIKLKAIKVSSV